MLNQNFFDEGWSMRPSKSKRREVFNLKDGISDKFVTTGRAQ